ncbi:MAG: DNA mismatch repair protein MutS, partial [Candidatus Acidiferrales bacterium]
MTTPSLTPLMRQYQAVKKQYPHALLLFRLGDFYELFYDDAVVAAKELEITLTARHKERGTPVPMCGVPYHAAESYIARLIRRGYKVAVCEQLEEPGKGKKLVRRDVVRVITPGTAMDAAALEPRENNYILACFPQPAAQAVGLAYADLSTGEFRVTEIAGRDWRQRMEEEISSLTPRELLRPQGQLPASDQRSSDITSFVETPLDDWIFAAEHCERLLREQFGVVTLEGFGLADKPRAMAAAGALLHYLRETQRSTLAHLERPAFYQQHDALVLDNVSVRNLELTEPLFGNDRSTTLLATVDDTITAAGGRLLKNWLLRPSVSLDEISARLDAVEELVNDTVTREELRLRLRRVFDLERLLSKCTLETATPRDLLALRDTFAFLPGLRRTFEPLAAPRLRALHAAVDELADLHQRLAETISDDAPASLTEPGVIRPGHSAELDELRSLRTHGQRYIAEMEARERQRTGVASLKVRFNNIFGYYIEVSKPNLSRVPGDYERKQTLVNAERYTTPELKDYERKVLDAEDKILTLEREVFGHVRQIAASHAQAIRGTAAAIAELDATAALAQVAAENRYVRPVFSTTGEMRIVA